MTLWRCSSDRAGVDAASMTFAFDAPQTGHCLPPGVLSMVSRPPSSRIFCRTPSKPKCPLLNCLWGKPDPPILHFQPNVLPLPRRYGHDERRKSGPSTGRPARAEPESLFAAVSDHRSTCPRSEGSSQCLAELISACLTGLRVHSEHAWMEANWLGSAR
jgi:hypothetical protein